MIRLDRISRVFEVGGQPVHALRGVTLTVDPGDLIDVYSRSAASLDISCPALS